MTPEGKAILLREEGEKLYAYPDTEGYLTIGCGHLIDERRGGGITQQVSRMLFDDDIARATAQCRSHFDWFDHLDPVRQDVIVNLVFNMGLAGFSTFRRMINDIIAKDWHDAAWQLANSHWGRQVSVERKSELSYALEKGRWEHPSFNRQ